MRQPTIFVFMDTRRNGKAAVVPRERAQTPDAALAKLLVNDHVVFEHRTAARPTSTVIAPDHRPTPARDIKTLTHSSGATVVRTASSGDGETPVHFEIPPKFLKFGHPILRSPIHGTLDLWICGVPYCPYGRLAPKFQTHVPGFEVNGPLAVPVSHAPPSAHVFSRDSATKHLHRGAARKQRRAPRCPAITPAPLEIYKRRLNRHCLGLLEPSLLCIASPALNSTTNAFHDCLGTTCRDAHMTGTREQVGIGNVVALPV